MPVLGGAGALSRQNVSSNWSLSYRHEFQARCPCHDHLRTISKGKQLKWKRFCLVVLRTVHLHSLPDSTAVFVILTEVERQRWWFLGQGALPTLRWKSRETNAEQTTQVQDISPRTAAAVQLATHSTLDPAQGSWQPKAAPREPESRSSPHIVLSPRMELPAH